MIITGDSRTTLATLPARSAQCCVTSPPYYGLRDYGMAGQIGLEQTPEAYVAEMVALFREVRRVLADDGTLWLNLGDSYTGNPTSGGTNRNKGGPAVRLATMAAKPGKPKDLLMIPARVALALQADGWWLRSDIIWHKPNPMPESMRDRPTSAHEHVFLLAKSERYFYDADAIKEAGVVPAGTSRRMGATAQAGTLRQDEDRIITVSGTRNARNVWTITPKPFKGAHFATMPPDLVERCILAGSRPGDTVLDPFSGAGTTALVAQRTGRRAVGIELNPEYVAIAEARIAADFADMLA